MDIFEQFFRPTISLQSIEKASEAKQYPPLASQDRDNLITSASLNSWITALQKVIYRNGISQHDLDVIGGSSQEKLLEAYTTRLRFISRSTMKKCLDQFAREISSIYSPEDSAILAMNDQSSIMIYKYLSRRLTKFPVVHYGYPYEEGLFLGDQKYGGKTYNDEKAPQFAHYLFVDDWILTGNQIGDKVLSREVSPGKLKVFVVAMSNIGEFRCRQAGVNAKWIYSIESDSSFSGNLHQDVWNTFPIYGFHKIPDNLTNIFADSAKNGAVPRYTIFPNWEIGRHSRLAETI